MTLQESIEILKEYYPDLPSNSPFKEPIRIALYAIISTIDIEQWDAEDAQIEQVCDRCNGQGCTKCS